MALSGIFKGIKGRIKFKEPLNRHATFKIGGPAKFFVEPKDSQDLRFLIVSAKKYKMPIRVIGAGSNILISDKGVRAMVIKLSAPFFKKVSIGNNFLIVGCGMPLGSLLRFTAGHALSGLEFLAGIPGTLGGALAMNAGAWGQTIGPLVENVRVMDYNGKIKTLNKKQIRFGYRKSSLTKYIILNARLRLHKRSKKEMNSALKEYLKLRRNSQDNSFPNAGCIFKNPRGQSAGQLIDLCGLKGRGWRDAVVSKRHANFILNRGSARCEDVLRLMVSIKKRVKSRFNINLEPEIKIWE